MSMIDRLRSMIGLDNSISNLSDATKRRAIRTDDDARIATHGDMTETTSNVRAFSKELDQRAKKVG